MRQFLLKKCCFQVSLKITKYFGYVCNKICCQELSNFAQSGHIDSLGSGHTDCFGGILEPSAPFSLPLEGKPLKLNNGTTLQLEIKTFLLFEAI